MKWLFILLVTAIFVVSAKGRCEVTDFYALSWISEPTMRHMELSRWLTTNGDSCSPEQLAGIWNKLAEWAGVADSAELRAKVLYYYARAQEREAK
jgi:hypothetical protein